MCRKLVHLVIVVMFMTGISVQADVVTYDFDDGTLQGWSNLEGATEEEFVVLNSVQARSPNYMVLEDNFADRDSDTVVKVLTSPAFWISATTSVEIWAIGGVGAVDAPTWTNYSNLPAVATSGDFMGAALRRVSDGEYLLFSRRSQVGEGSGAHMALGWDAPTIAAAVAADSPGEQYVVDIIDTYTALGADPWWAWIGVDDITLTDVAFTRPTVARGPNPEDEADDVPRDVVLSWTPGEFANKHDVYFGISFADVSDADRSDPRGVLAGEGQIDPTYEPSPRLDFSQTYYWRIDEVSAPPDSTIFKGDVWKFTIEPVAYPIAAERITVTASSSEPNQGPENTINSSGLTNDLHSEDLKAMWLTAQGANGPAWIQYEFDKVLRLHEMWVWNHNGLFEPMLGLGSKKVTIEYSTDGNDFTVLGTTDGFARAPGKSGYAHKTVDLGGIAAKYVRLTINSNWGNILPQYGLSEVRFYSVPVFAREPNPASAKTGVDVTSNLSWRAGREAAKHVLYMSKTQQAVTDGTAPVQTVTSPGYTPALDLASTYYWRVDEVNDAETPSLWQGDVWSLSTETFDVVEDFESYTNNSPKRVFQAWIDGAGFSPDEFFPQGNNGNGSGALVGYDPLAGNIMETKRVHGGRLSMPFYYGDGDKATSEATCTFDEPQDWTKHDIQSLVLYFTGTTSNKGAQLYVRINNGTKLLYQGAADDLRQPTWVMFGVDLAKAGVNLKSVSKLTIGVESAGASGSLLIDDIRLYPKPVETIAPVAPSTAGLVAHYPLDGDGKDATGRHNGTLVNSPTFVAGKSGQALNVTLDQYVNVPYAPDLGLNTFSVAAWVNVSDITGNRGIIGTRFNGDTTFDLKVSATLIHGDIGNGTAWLNTAVDVSVALSVGEWYHICYVFNDPADTVEMYLNGILARKMTVTGTPLMMKAGQDLRIGVDYPGETFRGSIDDVRIYNRPLSAAEVAGLAGRTIPFDKSL